MTHHGSVVSGHRNGSLMAALFVVAGAVGAAGVAPAASPGHIDFDEVDLPLATVEIDLSQGMFGSLFGIGDAALAGVGETLSESTEGGDEMRMAAERLAASRQLIQLVGQLVEEARVRVYEDIGDQADETNLISKFDTQLAAGNWEKVVRVHDGDENVCVALLHEGKAIRGALIVASEDGELVLVNVVCDISPEHVKQLSAAATKIGLENGLQQMIQMQIRQLEAHGHHGPMHESRKP